MRSRSHIHLLAVAAERVEQTGGAPDVVAALRKAADWNAILRAEGRDWKNRAEYEERRIERQRTLFNMLPSCNATDRFKAAVLQRAYDVLWEGDGSACDALLEFMPSKDADKVLEAYSTDNDGDKDKSQFYEAQA